MNPKIAISSFFNTTPVSDKETEFFSELNHDTLCSIFENWFNFNCLIRFRSVKSVNIQGIHDKGIDLIFDIKDKRNYRVGIQIKSDFDCGSSLESPIDKTLSNFPVFNLDLLIIIFCCNYTDRSRKAKVIMQISRLEGHPFRKNILILDPRSILMIFKPSMALSEYVKILDGVYKKPPIPRFNVIGVTGESFGFPIITIESKLLKQSKSRSFLKAYLSIFIGLVAEEEIVLGYIQNGKIITGLCPLQESVLGISVSNKTVPIPGWFMIGNEEFGPLKFSFSPSSGDRIEIIFEFLIQKTEFARQSHFKLLRGKFLRIAKRLEILGIINFLNLK